MRATKAQSEIHSPSTINTNYYAYLKKGQGLGQNFMLKDKPMVTLSKHKYNPNPHRKVELAEATINIYHNLNPIDKSFSYGQDKKRAGDF